MNKRIKKILILSIILNVFFILFSSKTFARNIDTNIDVNKITVVSGIIQS